MADDCLDMEQLKDLCVDGPVVFVYGKDDSDEEIVACPHCWMHLDSQQSLDLHMKTHEINEISSPVIASVTSVTSEAEELTTFEARAGSPPPLVVRTPTSLSITSITLPTSSANLPISSANLPISSAHLPISSANLPISRANLPLSSMNAVTPLIPKLPVIPLNASCFSKLTYI